MAWSDWAGPNITECCHLMLSPLSYITYTQHASQCMQPVGSSKVWARFQTPCNQITAATQCCQTACARCRRHLIRYLKNNFLLALSLHLTQPCALQVPGAADAGPAWPERSHGAAGAGGHATAHVCLRVHGQAERARRPEGRVVEILRMLVFEVLRSSRWRTATVLPRSPLPRARPCAVKTLSASKGPM
jgi:hypothetical protein